MEIVRCERCDKHIKNQAAVTVEDATFLRKISQSTDLLLKTTNMLLKKKEELVSIVSTRETDPPVMEMPPQVMETVRADTDLIYRSIQYVELWDRVEPLLSRMDDDELREVTSGGEMAMKNDELVDMIFRPGSVEQFFRFMKMMADHLSAVTGFSFTIATTF